MNAGHNVWYELLTTDMEAAKRFYTEVIGWKVTAFEGGNPNEPYEMWTVGDRPIGGMMDLPDNAKSMGAPTHWMAHTTVEDVDAAVEKAKSLGATLYHGPESIPGVGRFAVLADPQHATFAIFAPENDMPTEDGPMQFSWSELYTSDWEAAWKFYSEMFGWKHRSSMEMNGGTYFMWNAESGTTKGGMCNLMPGMQAPPHWMHYVTVDDLDATLERITRGGGQILNGPMDIPGGDRIAQCQDPQGGVFAVYEEGARS